MRHTAESQSKSHCLARSVQRIPLWHWLEVVRGKGRSHKQPGSRYHCFRLSIVSPAVLILVLQCLHLAKHVCCGLRDAVVDEAEEGAEVEFCAETLAARANAATVAKKRMLKTIVDII